MRGRSLVWLRGRPKPSCCWCRKLPWDVAPASTAALHENGRFPCHCDRYESSTGPYGLSRTIADARFAKPLDTDLIAGLARDHEVLITIEEGAAGGFGAHVMQYL